MDTTNSSRELHLTVANEDYLERGVKVQRVDKLAFDNTKTLAFFDQETFYTVREVTGRTVAVTAVETRHQNASFTSPLRSASSRI